MLPLACLLLAACGGIGERPYFIRSVGGYHDPASRPHYVAPGRAPSQAKLQANSAEAKSAALADKPKSLKKVADSYLGVPYRYGGTSRAGMDCSGFIQTVFLEARNLKLPRHTGAMYGEGKAVMRDELLPGDVVFFKRFAVIFHAGIYMGGGYFIHSSSTHGVSYTHLDSPYFKPKYAGARRVLP